MEKPINIRKKGIDAFLAPIGFYPINHTNIQELIFLSSHVKKKGLKWIMKLNLKRE